MAKSPRTIPANYPQPLGTQMLKAETQRQIAMVRQEVVTELLSILGETHETGVRSRLIKLVEANLRSGLAATRKAEDLWPELEEAREAIEKHAGEKAAMVKKHLSLFDQLDRIQRRYLDILHHSFDNIQVILDRLQPPLPAAAPAPSSGPARKN